MLEQSLNYDLFYPYNRKILELKYNTNDEVSVSQITKSLPCRVSSISKYITALTTQVVAFSIFFEVLISLNIYLGF